MPSDECYDTLPTNIWDVNIGSSNGLVPSRNRPLPEPKLAHFVVVYMVSLGLNELNSA